MVRQIAYKMTIGEINRSKYIQENEQGLSYLQTEDQRSIFRLNMVGIIINIQKQGNITNLWLEDGTEKIIVRIFEENDKVSSLFPGEVVLIIGKVRSYNQERYISPEIIKKVSSDWLKLRRLEYPEKYCVTSTSPVLDEEVSISPIKIEIKTLTMENKGDGLSIEEEEVIEEEEIKSEKEESILPTQKLLLLIKEKDKGEGVKIEEIISCSFLNDTETLIAKMLERGDIFQNLPGRVRVL